MNTYNIFLHYSFFRLERGICSDILDLLASHLSKRRAGGQIYFWDWFSRELYFKNYYVADVDLFRCDIITRKSCFYI